MNEWIEHIEDDFPKVERTEVSFDNKDSLKRYAISDEEIQRHFQNEISGVQLNESRKKRLKKEEDNRSVYFWISGMAAAWIAALVLRTFIVIPDKPAPVEFVYQRPEKNIEKNIERNIDKKIEQRDTINFIGSEWLIPWNDFNFEHYCGGSSYPDMWSPAYGYGFPNGTMPWSSLVYIPVVDSLDSIPIEVNQDSLLVAKIDSSLQQTKSKEQSAEYITVRDFIAQEIDERVQKIRKVRQLFRAARSRNREEHEDRMVIEWKGRRVNF
jgi:vacuolar-type H+-ATPase subunit F/Vma7